MLDKMDFPHSECESSYVAQKLFYLAVGGAFGAGIALLLAPKSGKELRAEIKTLAGRGYEETLAATNQLKEKTAEYYDTAKEAGAELLNVVAEGLSAVGEEVRHDMTKADRILREARRRPGSDQVF